jgi:Pectinacetylesterase
VKYVGLFLLLGCGSSAEVSTPLGTPVNDGGPPTVDASSIDAGQSPPLGEPFTTPANETWTWVDVPGTFCANGSPTGVGVNFTNQSTDVMVFLEGGGACWDGASCYGGQSVSTYLTGYGSNEFATDPQRTLFAVTRDASNPFRTMNMVYVPYCTGDVHAGNNVVNHPYLGIDHLTHHVGGKNLETILGRVAATFPKATHVWIAGDSAGGFGAALSVTVAKRNFPNAKLGILDDSGQPIAPAPDRWSAWKLAWNLQAPPGCQACADDPTAFIGYYQNQFPDVTFALLSFNPDPIISSFMGLLPTQFSTELGGTLSQIDRPGAHTKYFVALGSSHVVLTTPTPALTNWLQQMVDGSSDWKSQHP